MHPGAQTEYRSQPRNFYVKGKLISQPAQQCTYNKKGKLITSGAGAGTPDFSSSKYPEKHFYYDVYTFNFLSLGEYLSIWKPNQGNNGCPDPNKCDEK